MAYRDSVPPKRQRGTKHRQRRARRNHTPATNKSLPTYVDELRQFSQAELDYLKGYTFARPQAMSFATTKGAFDEDGNYHQED